MLGEKAMKTITNYCILRKKEQKKKDRESKNCGQENKRVSRNCWVRLMKMIFLGKAHKMTLKILYLDFHLFFIVRNPAKKLRNLI